MTRRVLPFMALALLLLPTAQAAGDGDNVCDYVPCAEVDGFYEPLRNLGCGTYPDLPVCSTTVVDIPLVGPVEIPGLCEDSPTFADCVHVGGLMDRLKELLLNSMNNLQMEPLDPEIP